MTKRFDCPLWQTSHQSCCPDGSVRHECPALRAAMDLPAPSIIDRFWNYLATHHRAAAVLVICLAWAASAYAGGPV